MLFCGIDIGTTNTKAIIIDKDARPRGKVHINGQADTQKSALSAKLWNDSFCQVLEEFKSQGLMDNEKLFCSITTQGGSFVLLDSNFQPISPAHSWMERNSEETAWDLQDKFGKKSYYHKTGWQPDSWLMACKLKDLAAQGVFETADVKYIATVPEYIQAQLTSDFVTDITNAQVTGMCDYKAGQWCPDILEWVGIKQDLLPKIIDELNIVEEDVPTPSGMISLVTSSHDQYAAMFAAGLETDKSIMLGTGTAWVINGKSIKPIVDENYLVHPGRDLLPNQFGFIATMGAIGAGFEKLLQRLNVNIQDLPQIESNFNPTDIPKEPLIADFDKGTIEGDFDQATSIRRYMEVAASAVAYLLQKIQPDAQKLVMTGGATQSNYWPQALANICNITIETLNLPEFTAYGAALFARAASGSNGNKQMSLNDFFELKVYQPQKAYYYDNWLKTSSGNQ